MQQDQVKTRRKYLDIFERLYAEIVAKAPVSTLVRHASRETELIQYERNLL